MQPLDCCGKEFAGSSTALIRVCPPYAAATFRYRTWGASEKNGTQMLRHIALHIALVALFVFGAAHTVTLERANG